MKGDMVRRTSKGEGYAEGQAERDCRVFLKNAFVLGRGYQSPKIEVTFLDRTDLLCAISGEGYKDDETSGEWSDPNIFG